MTIRPIRLFGDPVLRTACEPVTRFGNALARLVDDLLDTVQVPGRAGVAANQIGVSLAAFAYNVDGTLGYVITPVLTAAAGEQEGPEACLSIPGINATSRRAPHATGIGTDLRGDPVTVSAAMRSACSVVVAFEPAGPRGRRPRPRCSPILSARPVVTAWAGGAVARRSPGIVALRVRSLGLWPGELAQVGQGKCRAAQLGWLPGAGAQPIDHQAEVAVAKAVIDLGREASGHRAGQTHDEHADVTRGDIRAERGGPVGRVNQRLDGGEPGLAGAGDLFIVEGDLSQQRGNHRGRAHVDGPVHVPGQGGERVGFFAGRLAGLLGRTLHRVQGDLADQGQPVREPPVQGGDPGPGPPGDLLKGGTRAAFDEHITGRVQQPAPVIAGVGAQRPPRRAVPGRRHSDLGPQPGLPDRQLSGSRPQPEEFPPERG